jgi:hypothetical protein
MTTRPTNIIRHEHTRAFTVIANDVLNDDRLALDEKGLLCWYISLPADWEVIPAHVRKKHKIGRDKYHRIMKSLRTAGYARLVVERADDGTIVCIRHVITDLPADPASGTDSGIPDQRVCEIEDAELEAADGPEDDAHPCPEKPDMELTESGLSGPCKPVTRQSTQDLQKPPLPPRPEPAAQPQAVRSAPAFKALCAKWPGDRIVSPSASERRYLRLSDDRKQAAFDGVERFLAEQRSKGWKICDLQTYLRDRRFETVKGAPADATIVRAGTPQAYRWLEYYQAIGKPTSFLEERFRAGHPASFPTEWPPPLPASAKAS